MTKNDFNRPAYNEMVHQIENGNIELIITKALSRLNRDQLNSLQLADILVNQNATVYTLEDGQIYDFEDLGSELLLSLSYAIDAQYVKRQSINGRKTQELRCARKELSAKDARFGYLWDKNSKSIIIDPENADNVRFIFEEYVFHTQPIIAIKKMLYSQGLYISETSLTTILKDERYTGRFYINKLTTKLGTGKNKSRKIKRPREEWVLIERPELRIIDDDLFIMAQRVRQSRQTASMRPGTRPSYFQGHHEFSGKIFCSCCGKPYVFGFADRKKTIPEYRIRNHKDCINKINSISEADIEDITRIALRNAINNQEEACNSLEQILIECVSLAHNKSDDIDKLKKQKKSRERQIDSLIDALSEGGLTNSARVRIKEKINSIENDIVALSDSISQIESQKVDSSYVNKKIAEIKEAISDLKTFTTIDRERVQNYIDRIIICKNGDTELILTTGKSIALGQSFFSNSANKSSDVVKMHGQHPHKKGRHDYSNRKSSLHHEF